MKIIIYLGHPAQYHFFKYIINNLRKKNHELTILIKSKDVLEELLKNDGAKYINILPEGRKGTKFGILLGLLRRNIRMFRIVIKNKPDIMIGTDTSIAHVGKLLNIPAFTVIEDDYNIILPFAKLTYPFSTNIIAPTACNCGKWSNKKISYDGYMKLAYLHPKYFKPILMNSGKYFLIRSSALHAYHDNGIKGLNDDILRRIINLLEPHGQVKIISENSLAVEFQKYQLKINPTEMHNYLASSSLLISDSQSMSVEAAMLGIPSIRFSDFSGKIGVLEELEHKYGLTYGIPTNNPEKLFAKISDILSLVDSKIIFSQKRDKMLNEKINVTDFMVWFIESYPESAKIMKENPDFQSTFRESIKPKFVIRNHLVFVTY